MKSNMCKIDRAARIALGFVIGAATLLNAFGPYLSWVLAAIGAAMIVTGAIGICPMYSVVKLTSRKCRASRAKGECDCCCSGD
ncbi:MAG: DUF2892 domain-containing protein [Helicobacteraceae bacterium]|jgi:predicted phage tail protein|nr:DUF2892 domain-containing protein [Helicobacteraceae bacterium]